MIIMEEKIKISRRKKILQIILGVFLVVILFCGIFYYFIFFRGGNAAGFIFMLTTPDLAI